jgi:hypothetical protein
MTTLRSLVLTLSTGAIFLFFSEHLFWARARPGDSLVNWAQTWLAYSLLAFIFLTAVRHFRVRSLEALFLAGALVGWLGEGVLVQTLYDRFPLQVSWTGLAWHALISVCVGWYGLLLALSSKNAGRTMAVAAAVGAFWGLWAIFWWLEEPAYIASPPTFAAFAFATTGVLALGYWTFAHAGAREFRPGRASVTIAMALLLLVFGLSAVPAAPLALIVLPALLALVWVALARNRAVETRPDLLERLGTDRPPLRAYLPLGSMPIVACAIYAAAHALGLRWQTNWIVYLVSMPAGFVLFAIAWLRLMRRQRPATP